MELKVDLRNVSDEEGVLEILGEALGYDRGAFWGRNWNAFNDILRYLDTGGIWGNNKSFSFPVVIVLSNFQAFKERAPQGFAVLVDILKGAKEEYAKEEKEFDFRFLE